MTWPNPFATDETHSEQYAHGGHEPASIALTPIAWTEGQLVRLEQEWRQAQRAFAYHPFIGVAALAGDPPTEYRVDYRVRTLVIEPTTGEVHYVDGISVQIYMLGGFPGQPPLVRPMAQVFHPNITEEGVAFGSWSPTQSLVDVIRQVGEFMGYRAYDPEYVVNPDAMQWYIDNHESLPLDSVADLSATAGGEPLGRIARYGPATLEQIRHSIDELRQTLASEAPPPSLAEIETFARHTRNALGVFLEGDLPSNLSEVAAEFDDWTRELPASVPGWDFVRQRRLALKATAARIADVLDISEQLNAEISLLEKIVLQMPQTPHEAMQQIPQMTVLQPRQLALPNLIRECEARINALKAQLAVLAPSPPLLPGLRIDGPVARRLSVQVDDVVADTVSAHQSAASAMSTVRPVQSRAVSEQASLEAVVGWRRYLDTYARGSALERHIRLLGSTGLQAFFIESGGEKFGPFQLEEVVELGAARVYVRNISVRTIDVFDASAFRRLGRGANGDVTIQLPLDETQTYDAAFTLTDRCTDALAQFQFMRTQMFATLKRLQATPPGDASSWCGRAVRLFHGREAQEALRREFRKTDHRWHALSSDLASLSRFKERLATYFAITRTHEALDGLFNNLQEYRAALKDATQRTAAIAERSPRHPETDQMMIAPKLAATYTEQLKRRDESKKAIARTDALLKALGAELASRIRSRRLCGRPEIPQRRKLDPLSDALAALEPGMSDETLNHILADIGERLKMEMPSIKPPPQVETEEERRPSRPVAPAGAVAPQGEDALAAQSSDMPAPPPSPPGVASEPQEELGADPVEPILADDGEAVFLEPEGENAEEDLLVFDEADPVDEDRRA